MNNYRGWTVAYYAGQVPEHRYSASWFNRKSGQTVTLYAPNRAEIERQVDAYIRANNPCHAADLSIL